ncbi:MAG: hypothetical protein ACR65X_00865 [Methylocystis sp.]
MDPAFVADENFDGVADVVAADANGEALALEKDVARFVTAAK